jgi:threonine dehydratase
MSAVPAAGSTALPAAVLPGADDLSRAALLTAPLLPPTPMLRAFHLGDIAGAEVWVKCELANPTRAFKVRGGIVYLDKLLRLHPGTQGVIAASTGNHGQSVAWSARRAGLAARIVVPRGNPAHKNQAMRDLGAEVIEQGADFQEALEFSRALAAESGGVWHAVPSFHPWLVAGVAGYALEMLRQGPAPDVVFVPVGLGSGFCGVAAARAALGMNFELVAVVSAHAPAYAESFQQGRLVSAPVSTALAEGVACRTPDPGALAIILREAAAVVTVTDDEVVDAARDLAAETPPLAAEGAGVLSWAALKKQRARWRGARAFCVISGGNASQALLHRVSPPPASLARIAACPP